MKKAQAVIWIIWTVITILVAGGLFYYYQYIKIPELNNQISNLDSQIRDLQKQPKTGEESNQTEDWNTYFNSKAKITFTYPKDWEIREEYFYKEAQYPTIILCGKKEPADVLVNCIQINMPQAPLGKKHKEIQGNYINLYTEDPEIVAIYEKVVASFKVVK
jgi:hypothetical protein